MKSSELIGKTIKGASILSDTEAHYDPGSTLLLEFTDGSKVYISPDLDGENICIIPVNKMPHPETFVQVEEL